MCNAACPQSSASYSTLDRSWRNVDSPLEGASDCTSGDVTNSMNDGGIHDMGGSITLDAGAASAARIEYVIIFRQPWDDGTDSGAIIWDNAYANVVPTPGALALLGLAGLAGYR